MVVMVVVVVVVVVVASRLTGPLLWLAVCAEHMSQVFGAV
jgi:hypothetical protein